MGFHHQRECFAHSLNYVHCFFDVSYTSSQKLTAIIMLQLFFFCINSLIYNIYFVLLLLELLQNFWPISYGAGIY